MTQPGASGPGAIAIAAPHHLAVEAAADVVREGGNAVDAAVTAAAVLTVVYPHQCSIGGDLFALVRRPDGATVSVDASGRYGTGDLRGSATSHLTGPGSVTVPGVLSGWAALLELGGSRAVDRLLEPSIRMAGEGVPVTPRLAAAIGEVVVERDTSAALRALVTDGHGQPLRAGEELVQPRLAATLSELASEGLLSFYAGPLAEAVSSEMSQLGIPVTRDDLATHAAQLRDPLTADLPGLRVSTAPPGSQGYVFLSTMLAAQELSERGIEVDERTLLELFVVGNLRRDAELTDPDHMVVLREQLLSRAEIERSADRVVDRVQGSSRSASVNPADRPDGDTVAVTVVGRDGSAVSLIQSLFHSFGSRVHDTATGITFHNRAAGFSSDPRSVNALRPGKRPAHTLMPVLVEHADGTVAAHGAMGGLAQPQVHTQVLRARLGGATPAEAVAAPRFVVGAVEAGDPSDAVLAEPGVGEGAVTALATSGRRVRRGENLDEHVGHAMVCAVTADGALAAGADPRSDGGTAVVEPPAPESQLPRRPEGEVTHEVGTPAAIREV